MKPDEHWIERATQSATVREPELGPARTIELLPRHASMRRYARVSFASRTEVVMLLPAPGGGPEEAGGTTVDRASDEPFVHAQSWLASLGVRVPRLYAVDDERGCIWLEDVGSIDLDAWIATQPSLEEAYRGPIETLLHLQRVTGAGADVPAFVSSKTFGADLLRWELDHYREWRLEAELGVTLGQAERDALDREFDALVARLVEIPVAVMHRDFQSHNLMVLGPDIVVLDFQDAMLGPVVYDAVALLRDSYVTLPADVLERLVRSYAREASGLATFGGADPGTIERWFYLQTVQRKLKDAGRFVYIDRVKKNPGFLRYIPASISYVRDALQRLPELQGLRSLLQTLDPGLRP
jgi:aminoglycoside/choline kinase family phosphotransferase